MSAPRALSAAPSGFDCEVVDYQTISGDPNYYNNHVFTVKVWVQQHMYAVERSYASFCELDSRLRKQYARSNLPTLKLAGAALLPKLTKTLSGLKDSKKTITFPPDSEADHSNLKAFRRADTTEVISQKKKYLTAYLQVLLRIPEVVLSDILLYFLDEESVFGEPVSEAADDQADSREIMLMLNGLEMTTRMVRADRRQEVNVAANSVVLWSFNTLNHDVGFSVTYKDKEILKYQRYDSHLKLIKGHFEMPAAGMVTFIWDNSYSRWRSKTVNYIIRVVSKEEYEEAQIIATQQRKDKMLFAKQRAMMKNALVALSTSILAAKGNIIAATAIPSSHIVPNGIASPSYKDLHRNAMHERSSSNGSEELVASGSSSPTPSSTGNSEFPDLSDALREITRLKNEKKTLQQALSESETALVTERSITAQYIEQYEQSEQKSAALTEELTELKSEFDTFRENYFNEMEAKLAETLATFEAHSTTPDHNSATASDGPQLKRESSNGSVEKDSERQNSKNSEEKSQFAFHMNTSTVELNDTQPGSESSSVTDESGDGASLGSPAPPTEVSLNHLINFSAAELGAMSASTLVAHYAKLNEYTQQMLKRGYLTKEMEALLLRLKNEKKQLKAYAIQMKHSLDTLTTRYIHMDQDKALLMTQVKELKDIVALLEADRRGLREHISQLLSGDTAPSNKNVRSSSGEHSVDADISDTKPPLQRSHSNNSDGADFPRPPRRQSENNSSSMSLGIWSTLNSGIASATASANAVLSSFDFDDSSSVSQAPAQAPQRGSSPRQHTAPLLSQHVYSPPAESTGTTMDGPQSHQNNQASPTPLSSTKIVISMDDLKQAELHGEPALAALRNWRGEVEDTGSDCGYSVADDHSEAGDAPVTQGDAFALDAAAPGSQGNSGHTQGTDNAQGEPQNDVHSQPVGAGMDASATGYSSANANSNDTSDSGMPFTRVAEQLYGALPTWGQLQKLRSKSII